MEAGAVDFLAKPVNPHTVQKRVYDIIRQYWPAETLFLSKQTNSSADEAFSLVPETLNAKQMLSALRPWRESLSLLCSLRPGLSFEQMKRTANIVSALAKTYASYCNTPPLSDNDAVWISGLSLCLTMFYKRTQKILTKSTPSWVRKCLKRVHRFTPSFIMPPIFAAGITKTTTAPAGPSVRAETTFR